MSKILSVFVVVALVCGNSDALQCNEGFNVTIGGIPFYHWSERTCTANSKCFGQELEQTVGVEVAMAYGACISSAYENFLDCNQLFDESSSFDPAQLLNLIPDIEAQITALVVDFLQGGLNDFITIFSSDGESTESFIAGVIKFYENLGLNMENVKPLQPAIAGLLQAGVTGNQNATQEALDVFVAELGKLDTLNKEYAESIYSFIGNFVPPETITAYRFHPLVATLIEKLPGLVKSIFPESWESDLWYDLVIGLLGDLDITDFRQSIVDAVETIKATFTIPDEILPIVNPVFDALPNLIDELAKGNANYTGLWLLDLLPSYSSVDDATEALETALIAFIERVVPDAVIPDEVKKMIKYLPGLFYKVFMNDKDAIMDVYQKMANGFNSFNWEDLTDTADETKLSNLILFIMGRIIDDGVTIPQRALVINFSYMFYDLMSDFTTELDTFFQTIIDGFSSWPNINLGTVISDLFKAMGATVPPELQPLADNLQGILEVVSFQPIDTANLVAKIKAVADAYKTAYPASPFPDLVKELIDNLVAQATIDYTNPQAAIAESQRLTNELNSWQIDLQFAIFNEMDLSSEDFTQMIIDAFPEYSVYINVMKSVDQEDIKALLKDIADWSMSDDISTAGFLQATSATIEKITASLTDVMGQIRKLVRPESCKYGSCDTDLCNDHGYISSLLVAAYQDGTAPTGDLTTATMSTTTGAATFSPSLFLSIMTMLLACKTLVE